MSILPDSDSRSSALDEKAEILAFFAAVREGDGGAVAQMLNVNRQLARAQLCTGGWDALMLAVTLGDEELTRELLPHANLHHVNHKGQTALEVALGITLDKRTSPRSRWPGAPTERGWRCADLLVEGTPVERVKKSGNGSQKKINGGCHTVRR